MADAGEMGHQVRIQNTLYDTEYGPCNTVPVVVRYIPYFVFRPRESHSGSPVLDGPHSLGCPAPAPAMNFAPGSSEDASVILGYTVDMKRLL